MTDDRPLRRLLLGSISAAAGSVVVAFLTTVPPLVGPARRPPLAAGQRPPGNPRVPPALPTPTIACLGILPPADLSTAWRLVWTTTGGDGEFRSEPFAVASAPWLLVMRHREAEPGAGQMTLYLHHDGGGYGCPLGDVSGTAARIVRVERAGRFTVRTMTRLTEAWEVTAYESTGR